MISSKPQFSREFVSYALVGGVAFAADFTVYYLFTRTMGVHYLWANVWGFLAGSLVNYLLCLRFVFTYRKYRGATGREFSFFFGIGTFNLAVGELLLFVFTDLLAGGIYQSKILMTALVFFMNFSCRKLILFSRPRHG